MTLQSHESVCVTKTPFRKFGHNCGLIVENHHFEATRVNFLFYDLKETLGLYLLALVFQLDSIP